MSRSVCNGLGAYVDGDDHSERLFVTPCDAHPLPIPEDESADGVAGARVDACLDAIAAIRDAIWPRGFAEPSRPAVSILDVAISVGELATAMREVERVMAFLRPPACAHTTIADGSCAACGSAVQR
jgi:hypothetical protein